MMLLAQNDELNYKITGTPHGRCELTMPLGPGCVQAIRIPANEMSSEEWDLIQKARIGYKLLWGGDPDQDAVAEDPFDGLDPDSPYETFHFIGRVEIPGAPDRIITMRQVGIRPGLAEPEQIPPFEDAAFWLIRDRVTGDTQPLWERLTTLVDHPSQIVALSRTGTYPYNPKPATPLELEKERNPIAMAGMQVLATYDPAYRYVSNQLCLEFQERVNTIKDQSGETIRLDFAPTVQTLQLSDRYQVILNLDHPGVRAVKAYYPGYWVDAADAERVLRNALAEQLISIEQLNEIVSTIQISTRYQGDAVTSILTRPRYFKHLIPLLKENGRLRENMIDETKGRPYSSTLIPRRWHDSAFQLLRHAQDKYGAKPIAPAGITSLNSEASTSQRGHAG